VLFRTNDSESLLFTSFSARWMKDTILKWNSLYETWMCQTVHPQIRD
jgi:hypothetical protein